MNLYDHLQVNSNFFYFENELYKEYLKDYHNYKIKNLNTIFNQDSLDELIQDIIFQDEEAYISIKTDKGNFLLSNITNDLKKDKIIDILNKHSQNATSYYFNNVDYFAYGRFAISENNKIQRYLSFNSEAMDDENVVEWIGKPHKWEYATHTFYTKKKLEDFEMFFDSDAVCETITFYLPFIENDLEIKEFIIFSKNKNYINKMKKRINPSYLSLTKKSINDIYNHLVDIQINGLSILASVYDNKIVLNDYMLFNKNNDNFEDSEVLFANLRGDLYHYELNNECIFHNLLVQMINEIKKATFVKITKAAPFIKKIPDNELKRYIIYITFLNKNKFKLQLAQIDKDKTHLIYTCKNLKKKDSIKIYNEIKK